MLNLQKYSGKLVNFNRVMSEEEFIIQDIDRNVEAASILVTALAGLGGMAASQLHARSGRGEKADYVSFELNGISFSGWLWACPFQNGDEVEVVAAQDSKGQQIVYAIARPKDRLIAIYPHIGRSKKNHWRISLKTFFKVISAFILFFYGMFFAMGFSAENFGKWNAIAGFPIMIIGLVSFIIGVFCMIAGKLKYAIPLMFWTWGFLPFIDLMNDFLTLSPKGEKLLLVLSSSWLSVPIFYLGIHWYIVRMERFSKLTEQILTCLGESNVQEADLVKLSKSTPLDPSTVAIAEKDDPEKEGELSIEMHYGSKFFRY